MHLRGDDPASTADVAAAADADTGAPGDYLQLPARVNLRQRRMPAPGDHHLQRLMSEVSNSDLLGVLLTVEHRLGEMNGTMLGVKEQLQSDRLRTAAIELVQNSKHESAEKRLQSLEKYRWLQTGAAGALGALFTAAFGHRPPW